MANHNVSKVAQFAERVWDVPVSTDLKTVALEGIARFKAFLHEIGMPTTFKELGIEHPDIDLLVAHLHENKGELVGGYVRLDRQASRDTETRRHRAFLFSLCVFVPLCSIITSDI